MKKKHTLLQAVINKKGKFEGFVNGKDEVELYRKSKQLKLKLYGKLFKKLNEQYPIIKYMKYYQRIS